jgi:hypothetical protein
MLKVSPLKYYFRKLVKKYFVKLDPVLNSHYEIAAPITFAGDFEIEAEFITTSTGVENTLCGHELYLKFRVANGKLHLLVGNGTQWYINETISSGGLLNDGKLHKAKLTKVGDVHKVFADGVEVMNITDTAPMSPEVSFIGSALSSSYHFDGIIANAKFTDKSGASDVVTTFKLDNSPANNYTYSTEILNNNTFTDSANARQYLIATKGWIITDGGAAP